MEIITYVREGAITHRDSMNNEGRTEAGDVQVMSAGKGVTHSEYNLEDKTTRIFQIWIIPDQRGGEPAWGARPFPKDDRAGKFVTLASGLPGDDGALPIRTGARVLGATIRAGESVTYETTPDRHLYLVPATGSIRIEDQTAEARDGVGVRRKTGLRGDGIVVPDTQVAPAGPCRVVVTGKGKMMVRIEPAVIGGPQRVEFPDLDHVIYSVTAS